jgi:phosphatidylserine/phosphatidylglycerophosphate/cardiolipin synthase-like enzyme
MKFRPLLAGLVLSLCLFSAVWAANPEIYFSRTDPVAKVISREITSARQSVRVMMYSFTDKDLAAALIEASMRGVDVRIIIDRNQSSERNSVSSTLLDALGPERVVFRSGRGRGVMHQKLAVFDGMTVTLGSYNWTANAKANNWENLVVLRDAKIAAECLAEFQRIWDSPAPRPREPKDGEKQPAKEPAPKTRSTPARKS